jgi:hypothetical protein
MATNVTNNDIANHKLSNIVIERINWAATDKKIHKKQYHFLLN